MLPLFEKDRPDWETKFADVNDYVLSVMPGESDKSYYDPIIKKNVKWEQDVYCPTCQIFNGRIVCVYRSFGEDEQWRMGLGWSDDGINFTRSAEPVFHAKPEDEFLGSLRDIGQASISYGDSALYVDESGRYFLMFNYFSHGYVNNQELAMASTMDFVNWTMHGRLFAKIADKDIDVVPEKLSARMVRSAIVTKLIDDKLVAVKINGKYWMYLGCQSTINGKCVLVAASENMIDWDILRDENGQLVIALDPRLGEFDSAYIDTTNAVLRDDGILLFYNGINAAPEDGGDTRRGTFAHYPAQALFDKNDPAKLLKRSDSPFKGGNEELEKKPIVFCYSPLYESWSLVPFKDELLFYWNHGFERRAVGLWKCPIPDNMR